MNDAECRLRYLHTNFRAKWVLDHEKLHNDLYFEEHFHKHYLKRPQSHHFSCVGKQNHDWRETVCLSNLSTERFLFLILEVTAFPFMTSIKDYMERNPPGLKDYSPNGFWFFFVKKHLRWEIVLLIPGRMEWGMLRKKNDEVRRWTSRKRWWWNELWAPGMFLFFLSHASQIPLPRYIRHFCFLNKNHVKYD